jgi:hypothetical protein
VLRRLLVRGVDDDDAADAEVLGEGERKEALRDEALADTMLLHPVGQFGIRHLVGGDERVFRQFGECGDDADRIRRFLEEAGEPAA